MKLEEILSKVKLGMSREDVVDILGKPDDFVRRKNIASSPIFKYGDIELWFDNCSHLAAIWNEKDEKVVIGR